MNHELEMKNLTLAESDTQLLEMLQNNIQYIYNKFIKNNDNDINSFHNEVQQIINDKIKYDKVYSIDKILNNLTDDDNNTTHYSDNESEFSTLESINISDCELNNSDDELDIDYTNNTK